MATVFGGGSSTFGKSGGAFGGGYTGGGGGSHSGSLLGNLGSDIVNTVEGFGPGLVQLVEHPVKTGGAVVQNYKDTYGPLFQGHFEQFWKNVHAHPLGPLLDLATIADFGAGALGRAVSATAEADSAVARNLGYQAGVNVTKLHPSLGDEFGFSKATSANPLRRLRQTVTHKALNHLPTQMNFLGESARYVRSMRSLGSNAVADLVNKGARYAKAYDALKNNTERSMLKIIPSGLGVGDAPGTYLHTLGEHSAATGTEVPKETLAAFHNPDTVDLYNRVLQQNKSGEIVDKDVARVLEAHKLGQEVAAADAAIKGIPAEEQLSRIYRHQIVQRGFRILPKDQYFQTADGKLLRSVDGVTGKDIIKGGKKVDLADQAIIGELTPTQAHEAILTYAPKLAKVKSKIAENKVYDWVHPVTGAKPDIGAIADELKATGHPGLFYVPDKSDFLQGNPGPAGVRSLGHEQVRQKVANELHVYHAGQLLLNQNLLGREFLKSVHVAQSNAILDKLYEDGFRTAPKNYDEMAAAPEGVKIKPEYGPPEKGMAYLKPKSERYEGGADPTEFLDRSRPEFERLMGDKAGLKQRFADYNKLPDPKDSITFNPHDAAMDGPYLVQVPIDTVNKLSKDIRKTQTGVQALLHKPTLVWKDFVLATRPGFLTTNVLGNSMLYALRHAGPEGTWALGRQIFDHARGGGNTLHAGVSKEWVNKFMPEQSIENTFTNTSVVNREFAHGTFQRTFNKWLTKLYGINATHEALLRRATLDAASRSLPEIKERLSFLDAQIKNGRIDLKGESKIEWAIRTAPEAVRRQISSMADDVMGNYRDYSQGEMYMRELVPFYAWNRHAARSSLALLRDRPGVVDAAQNIGQVGFDQNQRLLGDVPEFMRAYAPLPGVSILGGSAGPGKINVVNTSSINPFTTVVDTARAVKELASGKAGAPAPELGSSLNPFLQSIIEQFTGKSLLTGAPPKTNLGLGILGALAAPIINTPQVQIGEKLLGLTSTSPNAVTSHDWTSTLGAFAGVPVKKLNLAAAQSWEKKRKSQAGLTPITIYK